MSKSPKSSWLPRRFTLGRDFRWCWDSWEHSISGSLAGFSWFHDLSRRHMSPTVPRGENSDLDQTWSNWLLVIVFLLLLMLTLIRNVNQHQPKWLFSEDDHSFFSFFNIIPSFLKTGTPQTWPNGVLVASRRCYLKKKVWGHRTGNLAVSNKWFPKIASFHRESDDGPADLWVPYFQRNQYTAHEPQLSYPLHVVQGTNPDFLNASVLIVFQVYLAQFCHDFGHIWNTVWWAPRNYIAKAIARNGNKSCCCYCSHAEDWKKKQQDTATQHLASDLPPREETFPWTSIGALQAATPCFVSASHSQKSQQSSGHSLLLHRCVL
jgi:hypothetical protein